ncbi:MAG: PSD1 and planctomycete cytochrome C domain-containing protein [Planctomycetaceae bacterium]
MFRSLHRSLAVSLSWLVLCGGVTVPAGSHEAIQTFKPREAERIIDDRGRHTADEGTEFFEKEIRPVLIKHCYECHSESAGEREGGLLLDRESGWLKGGNTQQAIVPGEPEASLLLKAVKYQDENLQMPPDGPLPEKTIALLEQWVLRGAPGPETDLKESAFSRLGDQSYLFTQASSHWAFQPLKVVNPPAVAQRGWEANPVDRFVARALARHELTPSPPADPRTLLRRLSYDLTGLPPTAGEVADFIDAAVMDRATAAPAAIDRLLDSPAYGEHMARMWLDVARYADTDSSYRPDTKTPKYLPFAFSYRNYVINAFTEDKPYDVFIKEQLAADLSGCGENARERAALGFLATGPHLNPRDDRIDDWIDVTTRGFLGLSVACARCHDHKFEPVPTADYYSLYGVFASVERSDPLKEESLPLVDGCEPVADRVADYESRRKKVDAAIKQAGNSKARNNNRSIAQRIEETDLAELLTFHEGAPVRMMVVHERDKPVTPRIFLRGESSQRGDAVPRRFLKILDLEQTPFTDANSGRLELAERIASPDNPLTARVYVNRVWGWLMGSYLVNTPSDFGLQGANPTHPELLDWLAADFIAHGWSTKHLVQLIVSSRTYQQRSDDRSDAAPSDPENQLYWRANRKSLSIEQMRDSLLAVAGDLNRDRHDRSEPLWGENYTKHRSVYGFINRFNLDPTLRSFDFPSPVQSSDSRVSSIVAQQALFTMNSPFVVDQSKAIISSGEFSACPDNAARIEFLFQRIFQRPATRAEITRIEKLLAQQKKFFDQPRADKLQSPWSLVAQAIMMSNEFLYLD